MISKPEVLTILAKITQFAAVPTSVLAGRLWWGTPVNSACGIVGWRRASGEMWDVPGECYTTVMFRLYDYVRDEEGSILGPARKGKMAILVGSGRWRANYRKYKFDLDHMDIIDREPTGLLVASADMVCTKDTLYTGSEDSRVGKRMAVAAVENDGRKMHLRWYGEEAGIFVVRYGCWRFRIHTDYDRE